MKGKETFEMLCNNGLIQENKPVRLHLGCGELHFDGYINIDYPPVEHNLINVAADVYADINQLDFPAGVIDEVRLHHVFEHFNRVTALVLLIRWHSWLKIGGTLVIETPDLMGSARTMLSDASFQEKMAVVRHLAGDQAARWAYHVDHWFQERFEKTLGNLGFQVLQTNLMSWTREPHLSNVLVVAQKIQDLPLEEQFKRASDILWYSTVDSTEKAMHQVWREQLADLLFPVEKTTQGKPAGGEKHPVSFFIPAYNCEGTLEESVLSIMDGNFSEGDELVIVNDGSTDGTEGLIDRLTARYPGIRKVNHRYNKGGGVARNTAVENSQHDILFCLDSDNILAPGSIGRLKNFMLKKDIDVAAFGEVHFFQSAKEQATHKWFFREETFLADYLSDHVVPGASGNYMFTRESWLRAGGYPEFAGAKDTWGFGFRQLATGSKMVAMPNSHYYHRYGHESYWIREQAKGKSSLICLQILLPYLHLIKDEDVDYIMSREGRYVWSDNLDKRSVRLK